MGNFSTRSLAVVLHRAAPMTYSFSEAKSALFENKQ
jgi:hypothetical protein